MEYLVMNGELYHHGIKGQKWGVRRWQNADGTYNAAGKKRYFSEGSGENYKPVGSGKQSNSSVEKEPKGLTDKQKKALKIGAAVAGTALVAYGAYKLNDKVTKDLMDSYKRVANVYRETGKSYGESAEMYRKFAKDAVRDHQSLRIQKSMNDASNSYLNRGIWATNEANRLDRLANSKFTTKEKLQAAKAILTKGSDNFKRMKMDEIDKDSSERIQRWVDGMHLEQLASNVWFDEHFKNA